MRNNLGPNRFLFFSIVAMRTVYQRVWPKSNGLTSKIRPMVFTSYRFLIFSM